MRERGGDALPPPARPFSAAGTTPPRDGGAVLPAGPAARRMARELGVDLHSVQGSGKRGRITPEDVRGAAASAPSRAGAGAFAGERGVPPGEAGSDSWGPTRREKLSQIRKAIAVQMSRSAGTIPHVTNFDDADITELDQIRKGVPQGFLGANLKLTATPLVMKAVAMALRRHPMLNASLDEERQQIVYKQYVNLGVAVDTPRGLVVPVMRNVDRMTVAQIAPELGTMAEKARLAKFAVEELRWDFHDQQYGRRGRDL